MTTSLDTLLDPQTEDELIASILADLTSLGFPVTSWQPGGVARTLVKVDARALEDLHAAVASIARGALLDEAAGDWLTLHALSRFDITRTPATFEEWDVAVTVAVGAGPYTITPGQLVVGTAGGLQYRSTNATNTTLPAGATTVRVRAELSGLSGHTTAGTITTLVSPAFAGVTVNNPTGPAVAGADAISDVDLRAQCRARWATIGYGATAAAYRYWATTCPTAPAVTRALAVTGPGDGHVTVYVATATGAASGAEVSAIQTYVDERKPLTDTAEVVSATAVTVTIKGTIHLPSTYDTTANRALVIGATGSLRTLEASIGMGGTVDLAAIHHACYAAAGVTNVDLTSPAADVVLTSSQVPVFDFSGLAFASP